MNKIKGMRSEQGRSQRSLASVMTQGDQPKVSQDEKAYVGQVMGQGGRKAGSKGSCHKSLGAVMGQGGGKQG